MEITSSTAVINCCVFSCFVFYFMLYACKSYVDDDNDE